MKSTPSLMALLGLAAVAGYQNRGKISDMLGDARQSQSSGAQPGFLSGLTDMLGSRASGGGMLASGLGDLVSRFTSGGQGNTAQSWVSSGPNAPLHDNDLASAIGDDTLDELVTKTGLSRSELIRRLAIAVPQVVNQMTPDGRLPTQSEAENFI